jgi:RHS repeat-associated protein
MLNRSFAESTTAQQFLFHLLARLACTATLLVGVSSAHACDGSGGTCPVPEPATLPINGPVNQGVANPINVISGNKYQREVDMPALPGVLGLEIVRHYNSLQSGPRRRPNALGRGWRLSYETELIASTYSIDITQADGSIITFSRDLVNRDVAVSQDPARGTVSVQHGSRGDTYVWTWPDGRRLSFDTDGHLQQIQAATGEILSLQYDAAGALVRVTDPQGRSLSLVWLDRDTARRRDRFRGVQTIGSPVGTFTYRYGSAPPKGVPQGTLTRLANLVQVDFPATAGDAALGRQYHYEDPDHPTLLTGISILSGTVGAAPAVSRYATYAYQADGRAVLSMHAGGADKVTLDFSQQGVTTITNSVGQKTVYRHGSIAGEGRIVEVRGPGCATCGESNRRYRYDQLGRLIEETRLDDKGNPVGATTTKLDHYGRPVLVSEVVYVNGKPARTQWLARYEYERGALFQPTLIARPSVVPGKEAALRFTYNDSGQTLTETEEGWAPAVAAGVAPARLVRRVTYTYRRINGRSLLVERDGPLANGPARTPQDSDITQFEYDRRGNAIVRTVAPGNIVTTFAEFDAAMRPATIRSTDGVRVTEVETRYANAGQPLAVDETAWYLDKDGQPERASERRNHVDYRYDGAGELASKTAPGSGMVRYVYDAAHRLTHVVAADDSQTAVSLDLDGRPVTQARYNAGGVLGTAERVAARGGEALRTAPASGSFTSMRYNPIDNVLEQRWVNGKQSLDAVFQLGVPGSASAGLVLGVTRPDGARVQRWFDDFGRMTALVEPERGLQTAEYSASDALLRLRDAQDNVTFVTRDVQDRALIVEVRARQAGAVDRTEYRYRGVALAGESHTEGGKPDSQIDWTSDVWGHVVGKRLTLPMGARGPVSLAVRREWDAEKRTVEMVYPSGTKVRYRLDDAGKPSAIDIDGEVLLSAIATRATRAGNRATDFTYANGLRARAQYDTGGQLVSFSNGVDILDFDRAGGTQIRSITRRSAQPPGAGQQMAQWPLPSLIGTAHAAVPAARSDVNGGPGARREYVYDLFDRLAGEAGGGSATPSVTYTPGGDRESPTRLPTDANGNVLAYRDMRLVYDARGLLREVRGANDAVVARYRYDSQGIRVAKEAGNTMRLFLYEDGQLIAEADGDGRVLVEYIYLGRRPVARLRFDDAARGGIMDNVLAAVRGPRPVVEYLHTDQRNAAEAVTDAKGTIVWRAGLSAFGVASAGVGPLHGMPLRLAGQYADAETGLYYNVHRYYDPLSGRYLQADPLGLEAGLNLYAYVDSDPLENNDPLGLNIDQDDLDVTKPWLFGTFVHTRFAEQVTALTDYDVEKKTGWTWGGNTQRNGTWENMRPDAYRTKNNDDFGNKSLPFAGTLWELKPVSWSKAQNSSKYKAGKKEVDDYVKYAQRGCWKAGSSIELVENLSPFKMVMYGKVWNISYVADKFDDTSGLLFYDKKKAEEKEVPQTVPAPALSTKDKESLDKSMAQVRGAMASEGWSTLKQTGMIVVIGVTIAAIIGALVLTGTAAAIGAAISAAVAAIVSSIGMLLAAVNSGTVALMAGLATVFGLAPTVVNAAEEKGKDKQKGLLDSVTEWFKSWF